MYYIGIDIGGTNLKAGLVDESYQIVAAKKTPLRFVSMEQMGETLVQMALDLLEENGVPREKVSSVGMGFPGPVDNKKGVVIKTVNIPIRFMPVAEMFHKHWDIPVYLGNDADCAALGEYYHFEDKNVESLILVTLGTGIGTGIILNGKILSGVNGCGGEGGHTVIVLRPQGVLGALRLRQRPHPSDHDRHGTAQGFLHVGPCGRRSEPRGRPHRL